MNMKKLFALMLVIVFAFSLAACGETPSLPATDTGSDSGTGTETKKAEFSHGRIEDDVYVNEFLGFRFTKPASWVYSTDAELAALVNQSVDMFFGDKYKDALEQSASVYDMLVIDSLTRSNVSVGYENLAKTFSSNITVSQYVEAMKRQFAGASGMKVTFPDTYETVKLGENEYTKVVCTTVSQGITMTQVYYLRKVDKNMGFVIVTIPAGYTVEQVEAMFR